MEVGGVGPAMMLRATDCVIAGKRTWHGTTGMTRTGEGVLRGWLERGPTCELQLSCGVRAVTRNYELASGHTWLQEGMGRGWKEENSGCPRDLQLDRRTI